MTKLRAVPPPGDDDFQLRPTSADTSPAVELLEELFDRLWAIYPRHVAKLESKREFMRLRPSLAICRAIQGDLGRRGWLRAMDYSEKQHIPHLRTYLHNRRWEDEE